MGKFADALENLADQIVREDTAKYIDLRTLPEDHPLRNTLLDKIGAEFKHCRSYEFTKVVPGRPLANCTYNDLEGVYAGHLYQWRVPSNNDTSTTGANG